MQNLRDKLLKAGLVSEEQAKKTETPAPKATRPAAASTNAAATAPEGGAVRAGALAFTLALAGVFMSIAVPPGRADDNRLG